MEKKIIQITVIEQNENEWKTSHTIEGIPLLLAGIILIDVGRDILASLAHSHEHEEEEAQEDNGD